jgi:MFS family permease
MISRTVWILSLVSLFTDTASEMLYPLMPIFLKSIGFSVVLIGILEGLAEATAGFSKGYFGKMSDLSGKRLPFVQLGYSLSALSKPMMALFTYPLWIFFSRSLDRLGKGIRTGARDAILSEEATAETKACIFGFHRSMDTLGAVIGPLFALFYLYFYPADYKTLFLIALAPGLLAIVCTLLIKEKKLEKATKIRQGFFSYFGYWKTATKDYRRLVIGLLFFALFNSSDVFLLLKAKESGLDDVQVIGVYIFYNLVYSIFAYPIGILADKAGIKKTLILGILVFAAVYAGISFASASYHFYLLFLLYGIYAAATEGISKAWITNISDKKDTATAIGFYSSFESIAALLASSLCGLLWFYGGSNLAFIITSVAALLTAIYLGIYTLQSKRE